ncbi:MAG: FAD-binding oxidoreductase [Clostridia bacterium]|nr:FAD-binding oxidoreductase [Clostridia bacterium]
MGYKPYEGFEPNWIREAAPADSYRSIFRWGDPNHFKFPKESLYKLMKERLDVDDSYAKDYRCDTGLEKVDFKGEYPPKIAQEHLDFFKTIYGDDMSQSDYDRLAVAYGQTAYDLYRIRERQFDSLPDVVLYPSESEQIEKTVDYCAKNKIPLYVYGGGSSVTRGVEPVKGGVTLDMRRHFNKVIRFNEIDQTITVQAGMSGPDLEKHLNNAVAEFGAKRAFTCGHFPQSFEYSSVGGWVVTRGSGQNSTYYGCISDIVLQQKYATPRGKVLTSRYPREATGPNLNQIMMGSEGTFGVLTEVTLKIFHYNPENRKRFSYIFKTWEDAMEFARECLQGEFGFSSVFRLSDPEETDMMLHLYNVDETPAEPVLKAMGYKPMERCLFLGFTDGDKSYSKNVAKNIFKVAMKHGGFPLTGYVCKGWEKGRFDDPYMRDSLHDFGIIIDTLECCVNWSNMAQVHRDVREVCHALPNTVVTTHMSHCYPQGANLYFIFIAKMDTAEEFKAYHKTILQAIQKSGAALSHHHGIGKMFAPWLEGSVGKTEFGTFLALKDYFDPDYTMNPGGTIGLDLKEEEKEFLREGYPDCANG